MNDFLMKEYKKESDYIINNYLEEISEKTEDRSIEDNCFKVSSVIYDNEPYDLYVHKTDTSTGFHLIPKEDNLYCGDFSHMITFDADLDGMNFSYLHKNEICEEFFNYNFILEEESIYSVYEYYARKYLNNQIHRFTAFTPDILKKYKKTIREEIKHASMVRRSPEKTVSHHINNINKIGKFNYLGQSNEFYNGQKYQARVSDETRLIKIHELNLGYNSKVLIKK